MIGIAVIERAGNIWIKGDESAGVAFVLKLTTNMKQHCWTTASH